MTDPNLQEIHDFLIGLAKRAGSMITSANPSTVGTKKNCSVNPVLGQSATSGRLTPAPTFVVDPIDGTTNFVHSHPYVSISMAFAHKQRALVGVVYNPFTQHLYSAIRGHGAFFTAPSIPTSHPPTNISSMSDADVGEYKVEATYERRKLPIQSPPPQLSNLSQAIVAVEWGNERSGPNWECKTATFAALAGDSSTNGAMVHSIRSLGSAALNLCAVARGDIDVYWEGGCWAWDWAAGWVILEEAGGTVVGGNKGEGEPKVDARRYLGLRAGAGKEIVEEFWSKIKGKLEYEDTD
ncbi:MAG: hypothetical protein LQ351_004139 [Letrouitia transgressa]|nr:MAG: hypothetical protein LQ351_004139 [Letrouitia transgressa]